MKKLVSLIFYIILVSGCTTQIGYITQYDSDPATRTFRKTHYTPTFISESAELAYESTFRVSVVITRKENSFCYGFAQFWGMLGEDDLHSSATAVVHLKNDSNAAHSIWLKTFRISPGEFESMFESKSTGQEISLAIPQFVLDANSRLNTKEINLKAPTYDLSFDLSIEYDLDGDSKTQTFLMKRLTVEERQSLMKQ